MTIAVKKRPKLKKLVIAAGLVLLLCVLFKGAIFRWLVTYSELKERPSYSLSDTGLIKLIDQKLAEEQPANTDDLVNLALDVTALHLSFSSAATSNDPNLSCKNGKAHCVGYAAFFDAVINYASAKSNIGLQSKPVAGKMYLLGYDLHKWFDGPFFRDHDFNVVKDDATGAVIYVDPSLYDYTGITYLRNKQ